jgi:hypothetical protein
MNYKCDGIINHLWEPRWKIKMDCFYLFLFCLLHLTKNNTVWPEQFKKVDMKVKCLRSSLLFKDTVREYVIIILPITATTSKHGWKRGTRRNLPASTSGMLGFCCETKQKAISILDRNVLFSTSYVILQ